MLAEVKKTNPWLVMGAEIALPGGTRRYSDVPYIQPGVGLFAPKVRAGSWGMISKSISDTRFNLESRETSFELIDTDRSFSRLLEGQLGPSVRRSAATFKLMSPRVAYADARTLFTGVLDTWEQNGLNWILRFRQNDLPLFRETPKLLITPNDFPNADPEVFGQAVPEIWGIHSSVGLGNAGMVPCPLVDSLEYRYLVQRGWAHAVPRVYADDTLVSSGYVILRDNFINGRMYTLIDFASDQGDAVITADVHGYETVGDGSGTLIENPATVLKHWLVNFVWNDVPSGIWLSDSAAPIDTTWFAAAEAYFNALSVKAAIRIASEEEAGRRLDSFCESFQIPAFWTDLGKLAIRPRPIHETSIYKTGRESWIRDFLDDLENSLRLGTESDGILDQLLVKYCHGATAGEFLQTLDLRNPSLDEEATETLDMPWSASYVV